MPVLTLCFGRGLRGNDFLNKNEYLMAKVQRSVGTLETGSSICFSVSMCPCLSVLGFGVGLGLGVD